MSRWHARNMVRSTPKFAAAVSLLAHIYRAQGRYAEAEPLHRRALAISEKDLGPNHPTGIHPDFPDYAAFVSPAPVSIPELQALLRDNEVLLLFIDTPSKQSTPEETFTWVVTKTESRWMRSVLGTPSLRREVAALRWAPFVLVGEGAAPR